jgi:tetratricopeptide (TPR) repeat protein
MKIIAAVQVIGLTLSLAATVSDSAAQTLKGETSKGATLSPAERAAETARKAIATTPIRAEAHTQLALALARRARETADPAYYTQAATAVDKALALSPGNFEAEKMRVWVLLGQHEFAQALLLAQALNKRVPDDLQVYGFLTDANIELGHYKEAEEACQWMLDLRPGNIAAFTRAAYLREIFGDFEGAIELMRHAYDRTLPSEVEDRAWMLTQLAHLELVAGRVANADLILAEALKLFPDYHYSLAGLAKVRTAQGRLAEAAVILEKHVAAAPHPENYFELAEALRKAGREPEARAAYSEFETKARREMSGWDNANRELIFYYAGQGKNQAEALKIAEMEMARRQDVPTLDAYAWALWVNDRRGDAKLAIDRALAVGVREPATIQRATVISDTSSRSPANR